MDYIEHLRSMVGNEKVIMVVAGALVFDQKGRLLLQLRSDNEEWGIPGGFMDLNESVQDTAKREVYEETGLKLGHMDLFGIYSGPDKDKTFPNGDQVALVQVCFKCHHFDGILVEENHESLQNQFFSLDDIPENIFSEHRVIIDNLLSERITPIIG
ncbi:NUDIX hydrolase [Pseudalkalibacillus berkeleyi]|uniref:NUDIX hydrolase n=1 Tax=Pseudalkalibacillus berkeleyi TaxID=1069813 RepID=A0ABS9H1N9_9BACL|nr:NUDIX hydrolase [Pseudalkalibacillus berkeleyi]MCF6137748.1 NUDIX hydrolase [Pseudalkalibacillus berkeleyi]